MNNAFSVGFCADGVRFAVVVQRACENLRRACGLRVCENYNRQINFFFVFRFIDVLLAVFVADSENYSLVENLVDAVCDNIERTAGVVSDIENNSLCARIFCVVKRGFKLFCTVSFKHRNSDVRNTAVQHFARNLNRFNFARLNVYVNHFAAAFNGNGKSFTCVFFNCRRNLRKSFAGHILAVDFFDYVIRQKSCFFGRSAVENVRNHRFFAVFRHLNTDACVISCAGFGKRIVFAGRNIFGIRVVKTCKIAGICPVLHFFFIDVAVKILIHKLVDTVQLCNSVGGLVI